jgi:hypothetical protein
MAIWSPHRRAETTISVDTLILSTDESKARLEKPQAPLLDAAKVLPNSEGTENKYADELPMVLGSFGKTFSVRTLNMLQSTFFRACNRSLSSAEWLSRWGEALGKSHCRIETAAGMLGKPLERGRG